MTLNIDPLLWSRLTHGDETSFLDFIGTHDLQHGAFDTLIRRLGGAPYATLPLGIAPRSVWLLGEPDTPVAFPFYPDDDWMQAHQVRHEGAASSLLIAAPPDFTAYDLQDPDEFATWTYLHALEHTRLRQSLGI